MTNKVDRQKNREGEIEEKLEQMLLTIIILVFDVKNCTSYCPPNKMFCSQRVRKTKQSVPTKWSVPYLCIYDQWFEILVYTDKHKNQEY